MANADNLKVTVSLEGVLHDAIHNTLQKIANSNGVMVTNIQASWVCQRSIGIKPVCLLDKVTIETESLHESI